MSSLVSEAQVTRWLCREKQLSHSAYRWDFAKFTLPFQPDVNTNLTILRNPLSRVIEYSKHFLIRLSRGWCGGELGVYSVSDEYSDIRRRLASAHHYLRIPRHRSRQSRCKIATNGGASFNDHRGPSRGRTHGRLSTSTAQWRGERGAGMRAAPGGAC